MFKNLDITGKAIRVGSLAAGAIATQAVQAKVIPMVIKNADSKVSNLITLGVGTFAPDLVWAAIRMRPKKKRGMPGTWDDALDGFSDGMVAVSAANLVMGFAPDGVKKTLGIQGIAGDGDEDWIVAGNDPGYASSAPSATQSEIMGVNAEIV